MTKYGVRNACFRCDMVSWGDKPLVTKSTMEARKAAHAAFDVFWKEKIITRGEAYRRLSKELNLDPTLCHISDMDEETALRVVEVTKNWDRGQKMDPAPTQ